MNIQTIQLSDTQSQPWKNGGGVTHELLTWPLHCGVDWLIRLSVANIDQDGAFSAFSGVQRWFAVLEGGGVTLDFDGRQHNQGLHALPLEFDGGDAPYCTLNQGSTLDLNLMSKRGQALMINMQRGSYFLTPAAWRAMYCVSPGVWRDSAGQSKPLAAHTLLWSDDATSRTHWFFDTTDPSIPLHGFWLSYQPLSEASV